jgi:hypothetical protein
VKMLEMLAMCKMYYKIGIFLGYPCGYIVKLSGRCEDQLHISRFVVGTIFRTTSHHYFASARFRSSANFALESGFTQSNSA